MMQVLSVHNRYIGDMISRARPGDDSMLYFITLYVYFIYTLYIMMLCFVFKFKIKYATAKLYEIYFNLQVLQKFTQ